MKNKQFPTQTISNFEITSFSGYPADTPKIAFVVDVFELIDHYAYHDSPSSVTQYLEIKDVEKLIEILTKELENLKSMENDE